MGDKQDFMPMCHAGIITYHPAKYNISGLRVGNSKNTYTNFCLLHEKIVPNM